MAQVAILGCGYVGERLIPILCDQGHSVVAIRRQPLPEMHPRSAVKWSALDLADPHSAARMPAILAGCDAVVHLAPPPAPDAIAREVERIAHALPTGVKTYVYGSTTGVFGQQAPDTWVNEDTSPGPRGPQGQVRACYEQCLLDADLPLKIVRIAGIYGPGRTLAGRLSSLVLLQDPPRTSRIHVEDLSRILAAMLNPTAPELVIAADSEPATTNEVAAFIAERTGEILPAPIDRIHAESRLGPRAYEMRTQGRACRSKYLPALIEAFRYPSYREGIPASLVPVAR